MATSQNHVIQFQLSYLVDIHENYNDMIRETILPLHPYREDPFLIVDLGIISRQYQRWKRNFPTITPYYAIKCNPDKNILALLNDLGCGFDVASKTEIATVLDLGVDPNRIIFANPCKYIQHVDYARNHNVDLLVVDSPAELHKIRFHHSEARILIRIKIDDSKSMCPFSTKFGVDMCDVKSLLLLAKQLRLNVCGVSFHVGSNCQDETAYKSAIANCKTVFQMAREPDVGINMHILDIGGGFPAGNKTDVVSFETIAKTIHDSINEYFGEEKNQIQFIAEPGRYFVASSHTLICTIINRKDRREGGYIYYISDGAYGTFSGGVFDHAKYEFIPCTPRSSSHTRFPSTVFGPTCDSLDVVVKDYPLPLLDIGEKLMVRNIGAYSTASGTEFNGFTTPLRQYIKTEIMSDEPEYPLSERHHKCCLC